MSVEATTRDVLIVGGGPAGASAAIHLAQRGVRVLLAERARFPRPKLCGEFISPECLAHFARLGVLGEMSAAGGARVEQTIFYTRAGRHAAVPSEWFGASGARAVGLSRAEMDNRLIARARRAGVEVLEGAQATELLFDEKGRVCGARLNLNGELFEHRSLLTIDATGRTHALARFVERNGGRYVAQPAPKRAPLVAFKAHLEGARGGASVCEIYFYGGGYGGLSPVENGLSNLCFIARAEDVKACGSDPGRVMREVLMKNRRAAHTLKDARAATDWLSVALEGFGRRKVAPAPGLLAIGDAAAFIDPFTGSGMLMALESGELAAEAVAHWLEQRGKFSDVFDALADDYGARYEARFGARLRLCGRLRRAAFASRPLVELAALALGASSRLRRRLARSTRASLKSAR